MTHQNVNNYVKVCPTYISSDRFTPFSGTERTTLPYVGKFERTWHDSTWGYELKGLRTLSANSCTAVGETGIERRPRPLAPYRNRLSVYREFDPREQPYEVTSLTLSNCRRNDQLIPNCVEFPAIDNCTKLELWTMKTARNPHSSHVCAFEHFPKRFESPEDTDLHYNQTRQASKLRNVTVQALRQMYSDIYNTTVTQNTYREWTEVNLNPGKNVGPLKKHTDEQLIEKDEVEKEDVGSQQYVDVYSPSCIACLKGYVEICFRCLGQHCSKAICPKANTIQHCLRPHWPSWPPGQMNFRQMRFPSTLLPSYTSKRLCALFNEPCVSIKSSSQYQEDDGQRKMKTATESSRDETGVQLRRRRTPLNIGEQFRTDAHKRFNKMYVESVPDLRDSFKHRKKYFFFGCHGAILR